MKTLLGFFALSLILFAAVTVFGDLAPPNPSPPKPAKVVYATGLDVVPDSKSYRARLQISQETLDGLREAMNAGTTNQSFTKRLAYNSTNTIIAGLFLFMSISFGGVWLMRSSRLANARGSKAAVAVMLSIAMLGAAVVITRANAGPPPSYFWRNLSKNLDAGKPTSGRVDIEIVPDGAGMKLIVPLRGTGASD